MRTKLSLVLAAVVMAGILVPIATQASPSGQVRAGVGVADATWHVGASAGQYASDQPCDVTSPQTCFGAPSVYDHDFDPNVLSTRRAPSYGIQSRNSVRALVVEGGDGTRVALLKNDLYIPQDLLNERIATILEDHDRNVELGLASGPRTGINHGNMMIAVSHSHSSPYYSTPSWGVWAFQDVFDLRFFEYIAQRSARAVIDAVAGLVPVRMGATTVAYDRAKHHSFGPAAADDGTPAGYPVSDGDKSISVLRFDRIDPATGALVAPLAIFMNLGLHPEMLEGNNLITGEYLAPLERMVDRATGATLVVAQNDTGTSETARNCQPHNDCTLRAEYDHKEYAQAERAARTIADAVIAGWNEIGRGEGTVPYSTDFPVAISDRQFAPPVSHPYPSVSNCRSHEAFDGNPGVPIAGLPDCYRLSQLTRDFTGSSQSLKPVFDTLGPLDPGLTYNELRRAGIPLPDNYSAPSYTGLQETFQVHLQAIRLGEVLITVCPCEQWSDQSLNIKSRANKVQNDHHLGFNWNCTQNVNQTWTCAHPSFAGGQTTVSDYNYRRMRAQVNNPADGWDALTNAHAAEAEAYEPADIKGNFTREELPPAFGYDLVMPVGMANDYWGYIATYREYQRGDHYRKALTGLGPHSADFFATRLVRMGGSLKGCPASLCPTDYNALDLAYMADGAHQRARAEVIGRDAALYTAAYERLLPPDGGVPAVVGQPSSIQRFDVTTMTWIGGSNYTDDPWVRVERKRTDGTWETAGDQTGDVVVTLDFPEVPDVTGYVSASHEWRWTAHFEAFDSEIDTARGRQTPAGTYRFVVDGVRRTLTGVEPYHLTSAEFAVTPWEGITVGDLQADASGASFVVGPVNVKPYNNGRYPRASNTPVVNLSSAAAGQIDYPDTWPSAKLPTAPEFGTKLFPRLERTAIGGQMYCFSCTFRPWVDAGTVATAHVHVTRSGGATEVVAATLQGGRWVANVALAAGDCVTVRRGDVVDTFGEFNGQGSATVCV